jgi:hypothetical protein
MDAVYQLEKTVEKWFENMPHLPKFVRAWLADNIWWIALISVILDVLSMLGTVRLDTLLTTILTALAVSPLKSKSRTGWELLFLSLVLSAVFDLVVDVVSLVSANGGYNLWSFVFNVLGVAIGFFIGGYFLFEIREKFMAKVKVPKKARARGTK